MGHLREQIDNHKDRGMLLVAGSRCDVVWRWRRLFSCLLCEVGVCVCVCVCVGKVFRFNHIIMINVQESPPSIMVTRNL
jgi:hypothetical protein